MLLSHHHLKSPLPPLVSVHRRRPGVSSMIGGGYLFPASPVALLLVLLQLGGAGTPSPTLGLGFGTRGRFLRCPSPASVVGSPRCSSRRAIPTSPGYITNLPSSSLA
uniref:Uncharacterized protein n=1 Tax=Arundo donax TaxID=35708 RepID=A0A0A8ZIE3_ARUDO